MSYYSAEEKWMIMRKTYLLYMWTYVDGLVQDCSIPSAFLMEILQSCTKPSKYLKEK